MDDSGERLEEYAKRREVGHFTGLYFLVSRLLPREPSVTIKILSLEKNDIGSFYIEVPTVIRRSKPFVSITLIAKDQSRLTSRVNPVTFNSCKKLQ